MTSIKIITKFRKVFSRFKENKISSTYLLQKTGLNSLGHCSSHLNKTMLRKSFKGLLNSCKLQISFKSQRKLSNVFLFKDRLPFDLVSGAVYKYTCGKCSSTYYGETNRHLKVRSEKAYWNTTFDI